MYGHEQFLVYKKEITTTSVVDAYRRIMSSNDEVRKCLEERNLSIKEASLSAGMQLKKLIQT